MLEKPRSDVWLTVRRRAFRRHELMEDIKGFEREMTENVFLNWVTKEIKHITTILPDYFIADYVIRLLTPWGERGGRRGGQFLFLVIYVTFLVIWCKVVAERKTRLHLWRSRGPEVKRTFYLILKTQISFLPSSLCSGWGHSLNKCLQVWLH